MNLTPVVRTYRRPWDRRETTVQRHIGDYDFGHYQATSVTPVDIEDYISNLLQEKRLSGSSIKKVVDVLNAAYTWAYERGTIDHNPVLPVKRSLVNRICKQEARQENDADVMVLSEAEQQRFEDYVRGLSTNLKRKELFGLYALLLLKTGLRIGELCACRWSDYDENMGILIIRKSHVRVKNRDKETADDMHTVTIEKSTKNQKARKIELFDDAREIMEEIRSETRWNKPNDYIIATRSGNPNTATNMEARIRRVFRDSGIFTGEQETGSLHIFRRTFATDCYYKKNIPLKLIAAYMGDLESTVLRYYIAAREKIVSADGKVQQVVRLHTK